MVESRSSVPSDFLNSLTVRVTRDGETTTVAGAVFGKKTLRLVRINDFYLEAVPEGYILMLNNRDVPGVVGARRHAARRARRSTSPDSSSAASEQRAWRSRSSTSTSRCRPPVLAELRRLPEIVSAQLVQL